MFRTYLGPSSGCTTVCMQQFVLIILFRWLSVVLVAWLDCNPTRTTDIHLQITISTICCIHTVVPPDDGPRYARNMKRLTKYTKNNLSIKLIFLYTIKRFYLRWMKFLPVLFGFGVWSGFRSGLYVLQRIYISRSVWGSNPKRLNHKHKFHRNVLVFGYLYLIGLNWSYEVLNWRNTHAQWSL